MSVFTSGHATTTKIGYINRNRQRCDGTRGVPGTDHYQRAYRMQCLAPKCGHVYGANGSDIFHRRCPNCQTGALGIPY
jgi:hypothetical protein